MIESIISSLKKAFDHFDIDDDDDDNDDDDDDYDDANLSMGIMMNMEYST